MATFCLSVGDIKYTAVRYDTAMATLAIRSRLKKIEQYHEDLEQIVGCMVNNQFYRHGDYAKPTVLSDSIEDQFLSTLVGILYGTRYITSSDGEDGSSGWMVLKCASDNVIGILSDVYKMPDYDIDPGHADIWHCTTTGIHFAVISETEYY